MTAALARLKRVLEKSERTLIGAMSGMSMDGVELALARFGAFAPKPSIELLDAMSCPYPPALRQRLLQGRYAPAAEVCQLDALVGHFFADSVNRFLKDHQIDPSSVDAIGSHGQTLAHIAPGRDGTAAATSQLVPSSLQVGNGNIIAQRTGLLVVSDFRQRDMCEGGQGAPLVSLLDYFLYSREEEAVAVNNLGSIANVTVVTPNVEDVFAFDAGPANMPIDFFVTAIPGNPFGIDRDGAISAQGSVHPALLAELLALPYFGWSPPKSAGYDDFGPAVLVQISSKYPSVGPLDKLRTAVEFSAVALASAYQRFVLPKRPELRQLLFSGGGVFNRTLIRRIRELLPTLTVTSLGDVDPRLVTAKEALAFALLGHATLAGQATTLAGVTGAQRAVVSGQISL